MSNTDGPQVFSRPGTKRYAEQVRRRRAWLSLRAFYAAHDAKLATERHVAAVAEHAATVVAVQEAEDRIAVVTTLLLAVAPVQGYA